MTSHPGLVFENVSLERTGGKTVGPISFELTEARVGLIGRNGSGKSTILRLAGALDYATGGRVLVGGADPREDMKAVRPRVGYLFQNPEAQLLLPTVYEDIALGLARGKRTAAQDAAVEAVLEEFAITHLSERYTHQLSGGEQQLVALAGAVIRRPQLLLLDEPTTHLDLSFTRRLHEEIQRLDQQMVIASHDLDLMTECDRVLVIEDGVVSFDGAAQAAIDHYVATI